MTHETLLVIAKTFGLVWLMVAFLVAAAMAYRPSKRREYERVARSVLPENQTEDRE